MLEIKDLYVSVETDDGDIEILKGINLNLDKGINVLMGPNGSGKSTLANVLMGNTKYKVTKGQILFNGEDITEMDVDKRAKLGIFMSFQYPEEIDGVTISNFLKEAYKGLHGEISFMDFRNLLKEKADLLGVDESFYGRYLNKGFSGGEKKKSEIFQLMMLDPKLAILDETDSGLDIDSLRNVAEGVNKFMKEDKIVLIITHYKRILNYISPNKVYIVKDGKIVLSGNSEIVDKLEEKGYGWIEEKTEEKKQGLINIG